jgi:hypothetical protein
MERTEQKKKENPIGKVSLIGRKEENTMDWLIDTIAVDDLVLKEEADKKKLERTISLLSSRWKASNTERMIYQKVKSGHRGRRKGEGTDCCYPL